MLWDVLYLVVILKIELLIPMSVCVKHNLKKMPLMIVQKLVQLMIKTQKGIQTIQICVYAKHNLKKITLVLVYKLVVIKLLTQKGIKTIQIYVYAKHNLKKITLVLVHHLVNLLMLTQRELIQFVNAKQVMKYKTMVIPLIVTNVQ